MLFVDDERAILNALERLFFDSDIEVFVAESGEEGLKILEKQPVDIVVSDMRMPVMNGHQFLHKVKSLYPSTTRIVLSGYASENELFASIIDGSNSIYLLKPWNNEELKEKIERIFNAREIYRNLAVLEFVNTLENLSMVTGIYNSVCRLIEQDADASAIAKVIEKDPVVTASVLRVVNSAFYNIKTGSVIQAIAYLGLPVIKSVVLSCSLIQSTHIHVPPFNASLLARHATRTNVIMNAIYSRLYDKKVPDNLATAGLLHNIGFVMFLHYFPEKYKNILREYSMPENKKTLPQFEKEIFGITHAELGGNLLDWWEIPYPIVECAIFHNTPLHKDVVDSEAVCVVHLASNYAWSSILPQLPRNFHEDVFQKLGMNRREFEVLLHDEIGE